jgi:[ribosomal protein S5]-alanine N-acetyltransferase
MASTPVLHTERLTLRPFRLGDAHRFVTLAGDPAVARMTSDIPHPLHVWQCRRWLRQARGEVRFAIEHDDELIGGVGYFCHRSRVGELGFWLGCPYWGMGFATEAARTVVHYAFTDGNLTALTSANFVDNPASARILEKLGFVSSGRMRTMSVARGHEVDGVTWQLDRDLARPLYALPHVVVAEAGGWTRLLARFAGR